MRADNELAGRLGLRRAGRDWRGTCPACGYADAFTLSVRDGRELAWCASCGDQAAVFAALRSAGLERRNNPVAPCPLPPQARASNARQGLAERLWREAGPVKATLAESYLERRGLSCLAQSGALRFLSSCPHPTGARLPAMVAAAVDSCGNLVAVHRTYIGDTGGKADIEPAKATLGPVMGGAIRLHGTAREIVIGEGIESSTSAGVLLGLPAWAAINAGNLARGVVLPDAVRSVVIAADNDRPGIGAADAAAARWRAEGRKVRLAVPDAPGADFNDVLMQRREVSNG